MENNKIVEINVYHKDTKKMKLFIRAIFNILNDLGYTWNSGSKIQENGDHYDDILEYNHVLQLYVKNKKMMYCDEYFVKDSIRFTINDSIKEIIKAIKQE